MLQQIASFIKSIGDFFNTVFNFVLDFISDLVYLVKLIGETVAKIPSYFEWLPAPVLAILASILAIVVIYKILGREG